MTKEEYMEYWIKSSKDDLDSAFTIFDVNKYHWALFVGHLSIEKLLKAIWIKDNPTNFPPKTHDLVLLAKQTSINFSKDQILLLQEITSFNLETRYPEQKNQFYDLCTKEFTEEKLEQIKSMHSWLMKMN